MKNIFRHIFSVALALSLSGTAMALDLPVKTINGKDYYYYAVKRGDTVLSIARAIGVTRDDIVRYNPSAGDLLRQGSTLYLPVSEFKDVMSSQLNSDDIEEPDRTVKPFGYKVQRGETLFGISHRFGVSPEAIVALNPSADRGIKAGQTLLIPAGATIPEEEVEAAVVPEAVKPVVEEPETVVEQPVAVIPVPAEVQETVPSVMPGDDLERELNPVPGPEIVYEEEIDTIRASIALMMPLSLAGDPASRQARTTTEFVKGFMMGIASVENPWPMDLYVYDTAAGPDTIAAIMSRPETQELKLIISSDAAPAFSSVVNSMGGRDTYLLNLMAVHDTTYMTDYRVMQYNVPNEIMYAKAAEALMLAFDGYRPVFLISKGGRSEKIPFTDYLRAQYAEAAVEPVEISFEGLLSSRDLEELDPQEKYVFIPASGSLQEFNKISRAIIAMREQAVDPSRVAVFGYPDWTTFLGDALENLHRMGAVIYSRFYANPDDPAVKAFIRDFEREYGAPMLEQVPSQAMLGYDTARYVMSNIADNHGQFDSEYPMPKRGLQSTFMFVDAETPLEIDGTANGAVYIISFLDGDEVSVRVL
ncbi:MAG: LysM peptidoglycan-binding domain-containing protein [Muribaculaceae bacterium]|nr:LysM peptidoglycan-binding domain-containing protein [Muribaculaceae bacterium]